MLPTGKPVDEIVLAPTISKALILSGTYFIILHPTHLMFWIDRQIFFFTIPSLELVQNIKPIRNVMAFAVDNLHLSRTVPPIDSPLPLLPVDFCVVKRTGIMLYSLRESLSYIKVSKCFDPISTNYPLLRLRTYRYKAGRSSPSDRNVSVHR